jgi:hypothetical protein
MNIFLDQSEMGKITVVLVIILYLVGNLVSQSCYIKGDSFFQISTFNNKTQLEVAGCGIHGWTAIAFSSTPSIQNMSHGVLFFDDNKSEAIYFKEHLGVIHDPHKEELNHPKVLHYESRYELFDKSAYLYTMNLTFDWKYAIIACHIVDHPKHNLTTGMYDFGYHTEFDIIQRNSGSKVSFNVRKFVLFGSH